MFEDDICLSLSLWNKSLAAWAQAVCWFCSVSATARAPGSWSGHHCYTVGTVLTDNTTWQDIHNHSCDVEGYTGLRILSSKWSTTTTVVLQFLTLQVDEEGTVAQQGIWGQVTGELTSQGDPGSHHQLNQLRGGGGGLLLKRLGVMLGVAWVDWAKGIYLTDPERFHLPPWVQTEDQVQWQSWVHIVQHFCLVWKTGRSPWWHKPLPLPPLVQVAATQNYFWSSHFWIRSLLLQTQVVSALISKQNTECRFSGVTTETKGDILSCPGACR